MQQPSANKGAPSGARGPHVRLDLKGAHQPGAESNRDGVLAPYWSPWTTCSPSVVAISVVDSSSCLLRELGWIFQPRSWICSAPIPAQIRA